MSGGVETNRPNTIDTCVDGNSGSYRNDESLEKIVVTSIDGSDIQGGTQVRIDATVYAWSSGSSDFADFFYTEDATNPNWIHIATRRPVAGKQTLSAECEITGGAPMQAVRVVFKYSSSGASPCPGGSYNDIDDLVFAVSMDGVPTKMPTTPPPTASSNGPQVASYDPAIDIPICEQYGNQCDSLGLLNGRGSRVGPELNHPNTLGSCTDGVGGSYHSDESLDKIVVRSGDTNAAGPGEDLIEGSLATIIATVWSWGSGSSDRADFYYTADIDTPNWVIIGTVTPSGGGEQVLKMDYTLPKGMNQAVRVNFRYGGSVSTCSGGYYDDTDDLAFTVKYNPAYADITDVGLIQVFEQKEDIIELDMDRYMGP